MGKQLTITDARGNTAMVIDCSEAERMELEAEVRALRKELRCKMRDLRQLRDTHELEAR